MPQLLDHTGTPFRSQERVSRRQEFQRAVDSRRESRIAARYDAAQTNTDNQNHWAAADGLSAAAANSPAVRRQLRNRARYEIANNSYASGMVRTVGNDVIGTGPALQLLSDDESGIPPADLKSVEWSWWLWNQQTRFAEKLRTMRMARCGDGEAFGVMVSNFALRHPVKLDLKLYEAEQIARPWGSFVDPLLADGINFDDMGNPMSYEVLREHPGNTTLVSGGLEADVVPAASMIHLFRADRPGQIRGVPEILPAIPLFAQLRRFTLAVLGAAETAADVAGMIESSAACEDPDDVEPLDILDIERRMLMTLPRGWKLSQLKAEQPATTYDMFKREIINEIARCLNMPYNVAAGTSMGMNYSSGRLDHKIWMKQVRVDRCDIERELDRLFVEWWKEFRQTGLCPESLSALSGTPKHAWAWDGEEFVDPQKEAAASVTLVDANLLTESEYHSRRGKDWEDQESQRARELGVSVAELKRLKRDKLFAPKPAAPPAAQPAPEPDDAEEV